MHNTNNIFFNSKQIDKNRPFEMKVSYISKGTACGRISSLAEVFTEWYLFDSSHEKNIQQFLNEEELNDIFTESEFIDLMCGNAYVDNDFLQIIFIKLPFRITQERLYLLNELVSKKNRSAHLINSKINIPDKFFESIQTKQQQQKEKYRQNRKKHKDRTHHVKHAYYIKNKEQIQKIKHEYYLQNQEKIKKYSKKYYDTNKERIKEYYKNNKEHRKTLHREYYIKNKETILERNRAYYDANKEKQKQYLKEYYIAHSEKQKQYIKKYYAESKQNKAIAQTMCAAYVFLSKLKKNPNKYLELYRKRQDPLRHMIKTCIALKNMDINMCPLCNEKSSNTLEQSCNQKILSIPGAQKQMKIIAKDLKQR